MAARNPRRELCRIPRQSYPHSFDEGERNRVVFDKSDVSALSKKARGHFLVVERQQQKKKQKGLLGVGCLGRFLFFDPGGFASPGVHCILKACR